MNLRQFLLFTVGGNPIIYQGETYTPTSDLTISKLLLDSVISMDSARFIWIDLSNFNLITPFNNKSEYKYVWIAEWLIPEDIMEEYYLKALIQNGRVLAEQRTRIYGLQQEGSFT